MKRSKAEMNIDILTVLARNQSGLILTHVMYKANVNSSVLKPMLNRLIEFGLIEKKIPEYIGLRRTLRKKQRERYFIITKGRETLALVDKLAKVGINLWDGRL